MPKSSRCYVCAIFYVFIGNFVHIGITNPAMFWLRDTFHIFTVKVVAV
jgi:hypothetical protein